LIGVMVDGMAPFHRTRWPLKISLLRFGGWIGIGAPLGQE